MKICVDTVATIRFDDAAVLGGGVFFNDITKFSEQSAWFHNFDGFVEAFSARFNNSDSVRILPGLFADIVCLVQIAVVASMVD